MVIDHVGYLMFPKIIILRIFGRIAFPIFAFLIAEGCKYTKNKVLHLATLFSFAVITQAIYMIYDNKVVYMNVFITFALSTIVIYALQYAKKSFLQGGTWEEKVFSVAAFLSSVLFTFFLCRSFFIDYGFFGCMMPVFVSLFSLHGMKLSEKGEKAKKYPDNRYVELFMLAIGILLLALNIDTMTYQGYGNIEFYAFFALPVLFFYNGRRGKWKMKYFFYIFYPVHLGIIGLLAELI